MVGLYLAAVWNSSAAIAAEPAGKIRVLIVDGQNNHNWRETTPHIQGLLEECGKFAVEIATAPPSPQSDEGMKRYGGSPERYQAEMAGFHPEFHRFDAIVLNYNGDLWPEATQAALENAVAGGKGLVVVHAADNAFPDWAGFNRMIGLGWRLAEFGVRLEIDAEGRIARVPPGAGPGSGHGERRPFLVATRASDHPITRGLPAAWLHARDELYNRLRGPAEEMTVLATAFDDPAEGGTGFHEPIAWTVAFGNGRVFHTTLGHNAEAMSCVGFITLLLRGTEWAATGKVSIPIPEDFPTASRASKRGGDWGAMASRLWPFALVLGLCAGLWLRLRRTKLRRVASAIPGIAIKRS